MVVETAETFLSQLTRTANNFLCGICRCWILTRILSAQLAMDSDDVVARTRLLGGSRCEKCHHSFRPVTLSLVSPRKKSGTSVAKAPDWRIWSSQWHWHSRRCRSKIVVEVDVEHHVGHDDVDFWSLQSLKPSSAKAEPRMTRSTSASACLCNEEAGE
jgi:hypothetical protein